MERRLAAIMAADMSGYSRMMERDEDNIIERQKSLRHDVFDPVIGRCQRRIIKTTGDGLLVKFSSAYDAMRAAIDIQKELIEPEHNRSAGGPRQVVGDLVETN
jgi:adenylate cyclase